jgi:hypothetical protein
MSSSSSSSDTVFTIPDYIMSSILPLLSSLVPSTIPSSDSSRVRAYISSSLLPVVKAIVDPILSSSSSSTPPAPPSSSSSSTP